MASPPELITTPGTTPPIADPEPTPEPEPSSPPDDVALEHPTRADAHRFLTQATFGPNEADVARVMAIGYEAWLDEQFATPASSHRLNWESADAAIKRANPSRFAYEAEVLNSFYQVAVTGQDQLRQRVAFALSQIFVISMNGTILQDRPRAAAAYLDMLAQQGLGNYRSLLESVTLHPMMGIFLSHIRNQKENATTGRVPDENYAREVMQLFSIGLYQLAIDGTPVRGADGYPVETYDSSDVSGLARVMTGWSYAGPDKSYDRFMGGNPAYQHPDKDWLPMQGYPAYHSVSSKSFLGTSIAAGAANPEGDLRLALDVLFNHANVGPFIGRQLIQRLVTSNPSPAYVARVARVFNNNGHGVRGDLRAVVKAVLLDADARDPAVAALPGFGKVREPVLRLTAVLRAFNAISDSQRFLIGATDSAATLLGQTPLRAPSVFNFYRPGYVAAGTSSGNAGLVAPELQITTETSVAGYANYIQGLVIAGIGTRNTTAANGTRNDVQLPLAATIAAIDDPAQMVDAVTARLLGASVDPDLKALMTQAVASQPVPALAANGSNQAAVATARRNRAALAIYLAAVSPEFIVQR